MHEHKLLNDYFRLALFLPNIKYGNSHDMLQWSITLQFFTLSILNGNLYCEICSKNVYKLWKIHRSKHPVIG